MEMVQLIIGFNVEGKDMKKILFSIAAALSIFAVSSCSNEDLGISKKDSPVFTASIDNPTSTKTTITGERKVNWESGDEISINGAVYTATPKSDATKADFAKKSGSDLQGNLPGIT